MSRRPPDIPAVAFPFASSGPAVVDGPRASQAGGVVGDGQGRPRAANSGRGAARARMSRRGRRRRGPSEVEGSRIVAGFHHHVHQSREPLHQTKLTPTRLMPTTSQYLFGVSVVIPSRVILPPLGFQDELI